MPRHSNWIHCRKNRRGLANGSETNACESNSRNQYSAISTSGENVAVSYDLDGNMAQDGVWTYSYDAAGRLATVESNGIAVAAFAYDARGRRVKKEAFDGTHLYFYDGWLLIYEHIVRPDNTTNEIDYVWGKDISGTRGGAAGIGGLLYLAVSDSSTPNSPTRQLYVPFYDNNGNITRYLDSSGNTVAQYTYDAFGNTISQSGPFADFFRHRFSTKYFDAESGLYYYGYRYYNPALMRWLNRDPIEEESGLNLYAMCGNNPISMADYMGLKWKITRDGKTFATAIPCNNEDTFVTLAADVALDFSDYTKWAHTADVVPVKGKAYLIPNTKIYHKGARRFYENLSYNVIGGWDADNEKQMDSDRKKGFCVVLKQSINNIDVMDALKHDGLYEYTFTGHGPGGGSIATEDFETYFAPERFSLYGIHKLTLQGCDTANDVVINGNVKTVGWASNVAIAGTFVGYKGKVNSFNASRNKVTRSGTNSAFMIPTNGEKK